MGDDAAAAVPPATLQGLEAPTEQQRGKIADLVMAISLRVADHSPITMEEMAEMTRLPVSEVTSASQAATIINYLECEASRSSHHFKACGCNLRMCWVPYCKAEAAQQGTAVDWRVTPARVTACIQALLDDESLKTLKTTRCALS